ncbi:MAG: Rieske (2Fe-2S) protein [Actinomycetota bacterium]
MTTHSRRAVLAAGAGGAVAAVTGCTVYGGDDDPAAGSDDGGPDDGGDADTGNGAGSGPDGAADGGEVLATTDEVEVGGGMILADQEVVLTQPSSGEFKGFTSVCTHQGCTVDSISDGTINCPCHGSRYSIEDGSVVQAATGLTPEQQEPLPEVPITVDGTSIRTG